MMITNYQVFLCLPLKILYFILIGIIRKIDIDDQNVSLINMGYESRLYVENLMH